VTFLRKHPSRPPTVTGPLTGESVLVVAATNRDASAIKHDVSKRFIFQARMPSLAERLEDVSLLARALVVAMLRAS
jgi:hypothetical protein